MSEERLEYFERAERDDLKRLLEFPAECKQVDYKSAVMFDEGTDFAAKLVKSVLALANSGGGCLVIGYREEAGRSLAPDPGLTDEIAASYDVTRFCQYLQRYVEGQDRVKVIIHREDVGGIRYPIVRVYPFREYPFVCTREFSPQLGRDESILRRGCVYVRTESAKTISLMRVDVDALAEWWEFVREAGRRWRETRP